MQRPGRRRAAAPTAPATAAAAAAVRQRHAVRGGDLHRRGSYTPARTCNGTGTCQTATAISCGRLPAARAATLPDHLHDRQRLRRAQHLQRRPVHEEAARHACAGGTECASGLCQQGVCCSSSCTGHLPVVRARRQRWARCTLVPVGADPLNQCTDDGAASCGTDGTCDGTGGCRLYAAGDVCAAATCAGSTFTPARTCDGAGTCQTRRRRSAIRTCATRAAPARRPARRPPTAPRQNTCIAGSCGKKPIGATCARRRRVQLAASASRASAAPPPASDLPVVRASPGTLGTCASVAPAAGSAQPVRRPGRRHLRHRRDVRRQRRAAVATRSDRRARRRRCTERRSRRRATCDGAGTCGTPAPPAAARTFAAPAARCLGTCTADARLRGPQRLHRRQLRQEAERRDLHGRGRVLERLLRAGSLLRDGLHGQLPSRARSPARPGPARWCRRAHDPLGQCADSGASTLRHRRRVRRRRRLPAVRERHGLRGRELHGRDVHARRAPATAPGTCQTTTPRLRHLRLRRRRLQDLVHGRRGLRRARTSASPARAAKKPTGIACARRGECQTGFCEQGICCTTACTGTCLSCALAGIARHLQPTSRPAHGPAEPVRGPGRDRAAAPTASATAPAAAGIYARGTQCAAATCTGSTLTSARSCNGTGTCQAATTSMCDPYSVRRARLPHDVHGRHAIASRPFTCIGGSCAKKATGVAAAPAASACRGSARRASAARPRAAAPASRARSRGRSAPAATSRRARIR